MINFFFPFILILLMGIFTACETAFLSVEKTKVRQARKEKKLWAMRTYNFMQAPDRFFATILVCEDFLLVVASTLFAQYIIINFGHNWVIVSTVILAFFSLIFGQFIPKSIALSNPERTLSILSEILYFIEIMFSPVIFVFSTIAGGLAYLFKRRSKTDIIRHQDIIFAMSEYEKDTSLLASRLFDFSKRTIREVMIPLEAALLCKKEDDVKSFCMQAQQVFTRIPIYEGNKNKIIGVINTKDYFYGEQVWLHPSFFVNFNKRCMSVFLAMKKKGEHMGIVQDNDNNVVGIVTLQDLIEELVGEIRDEK